MISIGAGCLFRFGDFGDEPSQVLDVPMVPFSTICRGWRILSGMDADEREIIQFLKPFGEQWVNAKEIARRAGGRKRFNEDPHWAKPVLQRLKERNVVDGDELGRYRIKQEPQKKHKGRWVSPDIEKILRESGIPLDTERADAAAEAGMEENPEHL